MKKIKQLVFTLVVAIISTISVQATPVFAMETAEEYVSEYSDNEAVYVCSFDLGDGLSCDAYMIPALSLLASGTITKTVAFNLSYEGTYFATLQQTTSWSYDGVNRPTLLSSSNVFQTTDTSKNRGVAISETTSNFQESARIYTMKADIYYNTSFLSRTNFSTICDKNGQLSYSCTDD